MKKIQVGVIDYGTGNLHSVAKALSLQGANVVVSSSREKLTLSDLLVLPGVGSFEPAMVALAKNKLDDFVRDWISKGKKYLGICLGLQLLFEKSAEGKNVKGLGVLAGSIDKFHFSGSQKKQLQIPHMGWNEVIPAQTQAKKYFKEIPAHARFYFVHSYFANPKNKSVIGATTEYGASFCSAVSDKNIFATQFHPEKSGEVGLKLLKNILTEVKKV
ncbi:MAG: imidazole glycerol phosphate synthase subunit HisH [Elusimicrobiota bacterium]